MYFAISILLITFIVWFWGSNAAPRIYQWGSHGPLITILAGTHGNEPAPAEYLNDYVKHLVELPPDVRIAIVPRVNSKALAWGSRSVPGQPDINRSWPDGHQINRHLRDLIDQSVLVIDFHEGWGLGECQSGTLGQSIYTSHENSTVSRAVRHLNTVFQDCMRWRQIQSLPPLVGSLDRYCAEKNIPYILVEMAGQNDVVPRETRYQQMQILLYELAGLS